MPKNEMKPVVPKGKQVQTVLDLTGPQPLMILECPVCQTRPDKIGARFCSECGSPLAWENVFIRRPEPKPAEAPAPTKEEEPQASEEPKPVN